MKLFMIWLGLMAVGIAGLVLAWFVADAIAQEPLPRTRPTFSMAHRAAHVVLDDYADLVDGHVIVGPCRREGHYSVVCRVRVDGPSATRYRLTVTGAPNNLFIVGAKTR